MKKEDKIFCNRCGKEVRVENDIVKEGIFSVRYPFGYFSNKDGQIHSFDLCEECYDYVTGTFQLPCTVEENKELL